MSDSKKFDPKKLAKLNDPKRMEYLNPDIIWEKTNIEGPSVLIDIGAGTGFFAFLFCKKMRNGKVYACDISEELLQWMDNHIPPESKGKIIPTKMDECAVPLPDSIADLVYMINLHHELYAPEHIIKESFRLLKAGAKLMIIDWRKENTPEGPPFEIRISADIIGNQMLASGFINIREYDVLPYHNFLIGEKKS